MLAGCSCCDRNRKWVAAHGLAWDRVYGLLLHREGWFMAFKELRRRFFCGGGAPQPLCPPACLGQGFSRRSIAASPSARPSPPPGRACTGLARERESVGEPGAACRARRGRPRAEGVAEGARGGAGAGRRGATERPTVPARDSPAGPAKDARAVLPAPSPPSAYPRRPVIALERFPSEHTPLLVNSPRSLPLCPSPFFKGLFESPRARDRLLLAEMALRFLAKRSWDAWGWEEGERQWSPLSHGGIHRPCIPWWSRGGTILGSLEG